jgi:glycosyltransferase involved in cell wall biosynthesis
MGSPQFHVLIVDDVPTPYRLALLREVHALGRFRMTVLFLAAAAREKQWALDIPDGLDIRYLPAFQYFVKALDTRLQLNWGLAGALRAIRPDIVVVGGYHHLGYWRCLLHCRWHGIPLIAWSGTTPMSEWRPWRALRLLKRAYIAGCSRSFAYGTAAKRFLVGLGAPADRVHRIYNTTDLRLFRDGWLAEAAKIPPPQGPLTLIFVGRITPYKGLQYVLDVLARLKPRYDFRFVIVGDGHYRRELERLVADLGLAGRVTFAGYAQQADLPPHLARADVFIFPSVQEVWGMVVNEALAAGLFVLSSTCAGVTEDLIDPAISGRPFDPRSSASIERALVAVLSDVEAIRARRDERSRWVMQYSADAVARSFADGVEAAWRESARHRDASERLSGALGPTP